MSREEDKIKSQSQDGQNGVASMPLTQPHSVGGQLKVLDIRNSNMSVTWKNWITQLKIYLRANNLEKEKDSRKVAILLHFIGAESLVLFYSFDVDIDVITFDELVKKFADHFTPKVNISMERHKLFNRRQRADEALEDYVTDLKNIRSLMFD